MFDYSKFNRVFEEHRFEFGYHLLNDTPLPVSVHQYEIEAFKKYKEIDRNKLKEYFLEIINQRERSSTQNSEKFYENKLNRIQKKYKGTDFVRSEIRKLHKSIFDTSENDSSIYNRARKEAVKRGISIEFNKYVANTSFENINGLKLNILKLIAINNFNSETEKSILYLKLKKRYVDNSFETFKDLFLKQENYDDIIKKIKDNKDIKKVDSFYEWRQIKGDKTLQTKTLTCVLGLILEERGYYKIKPTNKLIVDLLNSLFRINISYSYYGKVKKKIINFKTSISTDFSDYISYFFFIKEIKDKNFQ